LNGEEIIESGSLKDGGDARSLCCAG
jgi:hypothetical protein